MVKSSNASGLALRATVSHFSWWNIDLGSDVGFVRLRCVGTNTQFVLDSDCAVFGGSLLSDTAAQAQAGGNVPPNGFSEALSIPANQTMHFRGCAVVTTPQNERGRACGVTDVMVGVQETVEATIQLKLENDWTGAVTGNLSGVMTARLSFVGSSVTGTAKAFNATWEVNGTVNPDGSISLGLAVVGAASAEFTGNINTLRTEINGTWKATKGPATGLKGQFRINIVEN